MHLTTSQSIAFCIDLEASGSRHAFLGILLNSDRRVPAVPLTLRPVMGQLKLKFFARSVLENNLKLLHTER